ncbi:hypothetical protein JCM11641_007885 [Rhodosporidiobolus odoratus]
MSSMSSLSTSSVDLLILGSGWTGTFLLPLLDSHHPNLTYHATTRDGRSGTLKWTWDSDAQGPEQFERLPRAKTVVVVFPVRGEGGGRRLVEGYEESVGGKVRWIQLGSTGIFDNGPTLAACSVKGEPAPEFKWTDRHSPYDQSNARAMAEDELLSIHDETYVLNLAGLWYVLPSVPFVPFMPGGGSRLPWNWISRIAPSLEALEQKGSLHLIHGEDVARAIVAVHLSPPRPSAALSNIGAGQAEDKVETEKVPLVEEKVEKHRKLLGERYILTDLRVYDWWDLVSCWSPAPLSNATSAEYPSAWVQHLMQIHSIRAVPRSAKELGRAMDSREFWTRFRIMPSRGRVEKGNA